MAFGLYHVILYVCVLAKALNCNTHTQRGLQCKVLLLKEHVYWQDFWIKSLLLLSRENHASPKSHFWVRVSSVIMHFSSNPAGFQISYLA